MNEYVQLLIICFFFAVVTNQIAHMKKEIKRGKYAVIAIGFISGFAGFLITLLVQNVIPLHWMILGAVISIGYAYIMADAKVFESIN